MKRSKYSEEQVVGILGEVQSGKTVREVCKAHGLSEFTFYTWRKKYAGLGYRPPMVAAQDWNPLQATPSKNSNLLLLEYGRV